MIRKATRADIPALFQISRTARAYMEKSGNTTQWEPGYPDNYFEGDIAKGELYVLCNADGAPHAFFAFILGSDPSYAMIDGAWLNDRPYGTIHRLASDGTVKGVFSQCMAYCKAICPDIRADTHEMNATMRHLLEKHGFVYCGVVNLDKKEGDTLRVAYQYQG